MNDPTKGVDARSASARTPITIRQDIRATSDDVKRMVSDHYAASGVAVTPGNVSIDVSGGGGAGYSSSGPSFRGATIRFFGDVAKQAEAEGLPTTLNLTPEAVSSIVARRFGAGLGRVIHPTRIDWEVSAGGGAGYSSSAPYLRAALLRLELEI